MAKKSKKEQPIAVAKPSGIAALAKKLDTDLYAVLAIVAVWLIAVALINPSGNFPLNDDWCYARAVYSLIGNHQIHFASIITMTLIAQVVWGALFCLLFGPSFNALRASTLVLGLAGLLALYGLLREAKASRWAAVLGCLVFALNPIYLSLAHTFMTDVPFAALTLIAAYVFVKALKNDSAAMLALGIALACAAVLIRQVGIFLPIGFGLAYLVKNGVRGKSLLTAALPALVTAAVLVGFLHWLKVTHRLPPYFNIQAMNSKRFLDAGPRGWILAVLEIARIAYVYLGLFLLPFLIPTISRKSKALTAKQRNLNTVTSVVSALVVMGTLLREHLWMPINHVNGDYVTIFGIGPLKLHDIWITRIPNYPLVPIGVWVAATFAAVIGGALLLWHLMAAAQTFGKRSDESVSSFDRAFLTLMVSVTLMNLAVLVPLTAFVYFDRYLLCAIGFTIVVVALAARSQEKVNRICLAGAVVTLLVLGAFSIAGTHDYMAWNRVRWHAASELMRAQRISPREVDAGAEFNEWNNYDINGASQDQYGAVYDDYIITFGPVDGYEEMRKYTYRRWLPLGEGAIHVLVRTSY